jgi:hypothetical protein
MTLAPSCHVRFAGGDDLFGSLVSLDGETLEFDTWFGGTLKIPRAAIQTITFLPKNYSLVYEGPTDASDWVISGGPQQYSTTTGGIRVVGGGVAAVNNVVVINGNVVMVNSADLARSTQRGPQNWTYQDGGFVTGGAGTLGRNFNLAGSSTIEFDLSCNGPFSLWLDLYSASLASRGAINNRSLMIALTSGQITLMRTGLPANPYNLTSRPITNFDLSGKPAHVTIHCNEEEGSLAALVDGVEVKRWTNLGSFTGLGTGLVVQNQPAGGVVKLSHFRVSKWAGMYEPDLAPAGAANDDQVFFINRDKAGGKVEGVTGGNVNLSMGGGILRIPSERVRQIDFAPPGPAAEPRGPWEVRAFFPGGGSVSFKLEKWDDKSITGRSALFGPVTFQPGSIREMAFNLDATRTAPDVPLDALVPPTTQPARSPDLDYDVLDQ